MTDWSKYANFTEAEFVCHCGCGRADMKEPFLARLQWARDVYCHPIVVTSGYRCPEYDEAIGGAGVHPTGHAADIAVSGEDSFNMLFAALHVDMRGIGLKQHGPWDGRFMHLDDLSGPTRPRSWTYK